MYFLTMPFFSFNRFHAILGGNQRDLARAKNQKKLAEAKRGNRTDNMTVEQRKARLIFMFYFLIFLNMILYCFVFIKWNWMKKKKYETGMLMWCAKNKRKRKKPLQPSHPNSNIYDTHRYDNILNIIDLNLCQKQYIHSTSFILLTN